MIVEKGSLMDKLLPPNRKWFRFKPTWDVRDRKLLVRAGKPEEGITMIELTLPIRVQSEANLREHWAKKNKRAQEQRWLAKYEVAHSVHTVDWLAVMEPPYIITLTRIAPRPFDGDNNQRSLKAVRDGIADALEINDGSKQIDWQYGYLKGKPKEYAVKIQIKERE